MPTENGGQMAACPAFRVDPVFSGTSIGTGFEVVEFSAEVTEVFGIFSGEGREFGGIGFNGRDDCVENFDVYGVLEGELEVSAEDSTEVFTVVVFHIERG